MNVSHPTPDPSHPDPAPRALIDRLNQAIAGLTWPSESDYPLSVSGWSGDEPLSLLTLLDQTGHSDAEPIREVELRALFAPVVRLESWYGPDERAIAQRFQTLLDLIETTLNSVRVYRIGEVEIDVYIVGQANPTDWMILSTRLIET